nr:MAG TPA: hypothetical protein [Caudoviricetes sp.]
MHYDFLIYFFMHKKRLDKLNTYQAFLFLTFLTFFFALKHQHLLYAITIIAHYFCSCVPHQLSNFCVTVFSINADINFAVTPWICLLSAPAWRAAQGTSK